MAAAVATAGAVGGTGSSAASQPPRTIETLHEDMIHDAQLDYYGRKLATCSSDRTVRVFDVVEGSASGQGETLRGHEGPVWQVAWAHPKFGPILASASYDGKVIIWKNDGTAPAANTGGYGAYGQAPPSSSGGWQKIKEHALHGASVNSIAWAPHELGAILACASSDGNVSVLTFNDDGTWAVDMVAAHPIGANAVSWAPAAVPGSLISSQQPAAAAGGATADVPKVRRFASGGCDNSVKIWELSAEQGRWTEAEVLTGHTDWVRDVAFSPNIGLPRSYLATASQDRTVLIWTQDNPSSAWTKTQLTAQPFPGAVWRVSWSVTGQVLAVSADDGVVRLFKESLKGAWEEVSVLDS
ncbi:wd40 repeat-like protein [Ceraceosorus bombacis]|uniref:Wd40 repeat-like protein n=1 Tax=Ceraceosorus bombacis TaxID=401625 RepID=A0A0N7LAU4_9BASI|nr:wd40 repeat-like protein [Ceraceosorus bombacis]